MAKLTPIEKKVLRKFQKRKVKPVETEMTGVINPSTGKPLKFTTVNLSVNEQIAGTRLDNKGYLKTGSPPYFHTMKITEKGKKVLKRKK